MSSFDLILPADSDLIKSQSINSLPCSIEYSGKCEIAKYFFEEIDQKTGILHGNFRGHLLYGDMLELPCSSSGLLIKGVEENIKIIRSFDKIKLWAQEKNNRINNSKAITQWPIISNAV